MLVPSALWWLLAAVPVVALFFLRRRFRVHEVPALVFWLQTERQARFGQFGRRLRRWLSLLVELLIVLALVAALTEPARPGTGRELTLVLDDSATMQTVEAGGRTRFALAKDVVLDRLNHAPSGAAVTLVLAGRPPKLLVSGETRPERVRAALLSSRPREVNPQFDRAIALAERRRSTRSTPLIVVSDDVEDPARSAPGVEWLGIGQRHPNVGIAAIAAAEGAPGLDIILYQSGCTGVTAVLTISSGERQLAQTSVSLQQGPTVAHLGADLAPGQPFKVQLGPPDAFTLDNTAYGMWPSPATARIDLVTNGNLFLTAALEQPDAELRTLTWPQWQPEATRIAVLDHPPPGLRLNRHGRFLVIGGTDPFGLLGNEPGREDLTPSQWRPDHPVLRDVDLLQWHVTRTAGFGSPPAAQVLVRAGEVPLIFSVLDRDDPTDPQCGFAAVFVNFDFSDSDVVLRAAFPVFLWNTVEWLIGRRPEDDQIASGTGTPLSFGARYSRPERVTAPSGCEVSAYLDEGRLTLPFPEEAGFYTAGASPHQAIRAVNYVPDGRVTGVAEPQSSIVAHTSWALFDWPYWLLLVAGAGMLLLVELVLFQSRVVRLD